jgi:glycerol-3-phosphate dehydrogenase
MTRIGVAYGADPLTFLGLAGVGDLLLTCNSPTSRNYTVGYRLGKGDTLEDIIKTLGSVAEGVTTAKGAKKVVEELGVRAALVSGVRTFSVGLSSQPGTDHLQVYSVLYEGESSSEMGCR